MKRKKNKTIHKPNFKKLIFKRLIIALSVVTVLCTAAFITASVIYKAKIKDKVKDQINEIRFEAELLENKQDAITRIGDLDRSMQQYTDDVEKYGQQPLSCRVVNSKGNVLCDTYHKAYLQVEDEKKDGSEKLFPGGGTKRYFICHPDISDQVNALIDEYGKRMDKDFEKGKVFTYNCHKAYVDGQYCYPRISYGYYAINEYASKTKVFTELEGRDFFPEDTSGLKLYENDSETVSLLFYPINPFYIDKYDCVDTKLEAKMDKFVEELENIDNFKDDDITYTNGALIYSYPLTWADKDGEPMECCLFCAVNASFLEVFPIIVWTTAASVLIVTLVSVFIFTWISYTKEKANYEIFLARQETTNAMAHDLKTPLTSIAGYTELLQSDINPEKREHYEKMISQNVEQMNNTVSDILKLAKAEAGTQALEPEDISVQDVCRHVISELSAAFETNQLSCEFDVRSSPIINADRKLFTQAFKNLLHNAAVYSKHGTTVDVILTEKALCIMNTPEQMPKMSADELVKPFVKDDSSRSENAGSGVGLAIAKQDLERMGFELKLEIKDGKFKAAASFSH